MKRIISLILLAGLLIASFTLVSCSEEDSAPDGYQLVAKYGDEFRFYVPTQGWSPNTDGGITSAIYSMDPHVSVCVYVADDAFGMSIDAYWKYSAEKLEAELVKFEIVAEAEKGTLGGQYSERYVYTSEVSVAGKKDPIKYKYMTILSEKDGKIYVFSYCAPEADYYNGCFTDVEGMISNFTFDVPYDKGYVGEIPSGVEVPEGMKLASYDQHPYLFFIPESWEMNKGTVISSAYAPEGSRANVSLQMYMTSEKEIDKTVEEYFTECEAKYKQIFSKYTPVEDECGEIKMSGRDGRKYVYVVENGGQEYKQLQAIVVRGGVFYVLTYTATVEEFADHISDVESMIAAFKIR